MTTYQTPAPPVDRDVHGMLIGVEARNAGWMRFLIQEPGRQHPVRADTKRPEVIQQAMSLMNQPVTVNIREQLSSEINPRSGQPFMNRYLNQIAAQGYAPSVVPNPAYAAQNPPPGPVPQQQPQAQYAQPQAAPQYAQPQTAPAPQQPFQPGIQGFEKDVNIMRQTAAKVVAMSLESLPEEQRNQTGMIAACEAWIAYFVYGPLRFGLQPFSSPDGQAQMPSGSAQSAPEAQAAPAEGPCPHCGFTGTHALGCPEGEFAS